MSDVALTEALAKLQAFAAADLDQLESEARHDPEAFRSFARMVALVEQHVLVVSQSWNTAATQFNALAARLSSTRTLQ